MLRPRAAGIFMQHSHPYCSFPYSLPRRKTRCARHTQTRTVQARRYSRELCAHHLLRGLFLLDTSSLLIARSQSRAAHCSKCLIMFYLMRALCDEFANTHTHPHIEHKIYANTGKNGRWCDGKLSVRLHGCKLRRQPFCTRRSACRRASAQSHGCRASGCIIAVAAAQLFWYETKNTQHTQSHIYNLLTALRAAIRVETPLCARHCPFVSFFDMFRCATCTIYNIYK